MNKKYKFILGTLVSYLPIVTITSCANNKHEDPKQDKERDNTNKFPNENKKEELKKDNILNQEDKIDSNNNKTQNSKNIHSKSNKNNQNNINEDDNNNTNPKTKEQNDKFLILKDIKRKFKNEILKYENNGEKFSILKNDAKNAIDNINKILEKEDESNKKIQEEISKYNSLYEILNQKSDNIQLIFDLEQLSSVIKENNDKYENNNNKIELDGLNSKINENKIFIFNDNNNLQAIKEKNTQLYNLKTEYILKNKERINEIKTKNSALYKYIVTKEHAEALLNYLKNTSTNSFENVRNKFNEITNKSSSDFSNKINLLKKLVDDEKVKINNAQKENAKNLNLDHKSKSFTNYFEGYNFSTKNISTYNEKNEKVIYVGLLDMIFNLDGLFKNKGLNVIKKDKIIEYSLPNNEKIKIDLERNTFSATNANFWNFTKENDSLDPNIHLDIYKNKKIVKGKEWVEYSLADANFKFIDINNDILIPLPIFNILFANPNYYNLFLNNDNIIGFDTIYQKYQDKSNKISYISSNQDQKDRQYNFNTLKFLMNNFYGLKYKKFKDKKWEETISEYQKQLILSTEVTKNNYGYIDALQNNLSDRHTVVRNFSFYNSNFRESDESLNKISRYGGQNTNFNNSLLSTIFLYEQKSKYLELQNKSEYSDIRIEGNTAFLTTYGFDFKENNSTFNFYKEKLNQIKNDNNAKSEEEKIKNIVIDLATNGGGETISLFKALSFLTNKPIYDYQINKNDGSILLNYYNVDNNDDKYFSDKDSFQDDFKFYILTSNSTFSAANIMAHIAKDNNLATIIGNNSGGGAFSVLPTSLPDGTSLFISSVNGSFSNKDNNQNITNINDLTDVEEPAIPQIKIDYKDFYDLKFIDKLLTDKKDNNPISQLPNFALEKEKNNWGFSTKNLEEQKSLIDSEFEKIQESNLNITNSNDIYTFINNFQANELDSETKQSKNELQQTLSSVKQKIKLMLNKLNVNENQWVDQIENSYGFFLRAKDDNTLELTIMLTNLNESLLSRPLTIQFNKINNKEAS
ncbi:S41 family peptidase [Mycoplasma sp. CSL7503-lung]|uniref:S41 family peptidase n=1 Tax=Mycoplasma sp. CSL7503-lung TaxID=536372 RepID=UPI0021D27D1A|nr:S41 family peptidase [Mycoplasma sp. CSL7503-lung]MCU4706399.1 S41 family peptidase [Mycoplasma sp. CSL7503-lung]